MTAPLVIAIDPGGHRKGTACALFDECGNLYHVEIIRAGHGRPVDFSTRLVDGRIVVERPAYQGARTQGAHAGALIDLAWEGAAVAYYLSALYGYPVVARTPGEWKGSQRKPQQHARAWRLLTDRERAVLGGDSTGAAIDAACEKGALERWKKSGGDYYPARLGTLPDKLDATALGLVSLGRLL